MLKYTEDFYIENPNYNIKIVSKNRWMNYIDWLKNTFNRRHDGSARYYGTNKGNSIFSNYSSEMKGKLITLDEFERIILNKQEFIEIY